MQFRFRPEKHESGLFIPISFRIAIAAVLWLILITGLHYRLNGDHGNRRIIQMGYMPVITNLACPLLDYATAEGDGIRLKALKFASFAEMAEALRNDQIQFAFMIAPLAIVLRQQGEDIRIVYIGNRHESTLVARKDLNASTLADLTGKTVAVPMRYSGHFLSMMQLMEKHGLDHKIRIVEMNPPDMAAALISGSLDAYYVGEPFAAQTLKNGDAKALFYARDVWPGFICNLLVVKQTFIENHPDIVRMVVCGAARSGLWTQWNPKKAVEVVAQYWNQPADLIEFALTSPPHRIIFDRFVPRSEEIQDIADLMVHHKLIRQNDISSLVDATFANEVDLKEISDFKSILKKSGAASP